MKCDTKWEIEELLVKINCKFKINFIKQMWYALVSIVLCENSIFYEKFMWDAFFWRWSCHKTEEKVNPSKFT